MRIVKGARWDTKPCPACSSSQRHTVKVTFANGDSLVTGINGTRETVTSYYLGNTFNLGDGKGGDLMTKAMKVEFL